MILIDLQIVLTQAPLLLMFLCVTFNCQTCVQSMKNEQNHVLSFITLLKCLFYQHWEMLHVLKHSQQCTGLLPIYPLPNALLTTYYLCKNMNFP